MRRPSATGVDLGYILLLRLGVYTVNINRWAVILSIVAVALVLSCLVALLLMQQQRIGDESLTLAPAATVYSRLLELDATAGALLTQTAEYDPKTDPILLTATVEFATINAKRTAFAQTVTARATSTPSPIPTGRG